MFRHSEIQALIKEREAQLLETQLETQPPPNSAVEASTESTREAGPIFVRNNTQQPNTNQAERRRRRPRPAKSRRKAAAAALEEEQRKRRNSSSDLEEPKKKQEIEEARHDPKDFLADGDEKTYRRRAREQDEIKETTVELDY
jgi:hypothetical protein